MRNTSHPRTTSPCTTNLNIHNAHQSRDRKEAVPPEAKSLTYLITFACYGRHPHGAATGSIDREHNVPGTPILEANPTRAEAERDRMNQPPYNLDEVRRAAVLESIQEVCAHRGWGLLAAHARTSHVHAVVDAEVPPERVMVDLKSYASRRLNQMQLDEPAGKRWSRHGSTRWLWKPEQVAAAIQYVVHEQGDEMSAFESYER